MKNSQLFWIGAGGAIWLIAIAILQNIFEIPFFGVAGVAFGLIGLLMLNAQFKFKNSLKEQGLQTAQEEFEDLQIENEELQVKQTELTEHCENLTSELKNARMDLQILTANFERLKSENELAEAKLQKANDLLQSIKAEYEMQTSASTTKSKPSFLAKVK